MSFFNPTIPIKTRTLSKHPWERVIKDTYANKIKYAHNSANNPKYPKQKDKQPDVNRVQFTVIGDRVTKEFIYCVNLVKGMHKYRWKSFDAPVIRGVTSVEWPAVWHDLKIQYGGLAFCLKSRVAVLINDKLLGGEKELKDLIETKYVYHLCLDYYNESVSQFARFIKSSGRPCAYLHISIDNKHIGSMIFMLYADVVPYTCENFLRLCKEKKGGYVGTPVHRIVKDSWIQCGGFGLKSTDLDCENFIIPHDRRGVIGMANDGRHIDCSTQFFVLLHPAPWMAKKYVAFGQLIEGEETLKKIESVPTWYESPKSEITIHRCGIFNMECHNIMINRGANEYIQAHIEDLLALGEMLYEDLIERVFLQVEFRRLARLQQEGEGAEGEEEAAGGIRATQRFIRKKEDIEKQLEKNQVDNRKSLMESRKSIADSRRGTSARSEIENNDFDVEEYEYVYEPEEYSYKHVSLALTASLVVKPEKPFYIPLTDVPYPGEVDSTYDLKRFLKGDYCLESDLKQDSKLVIPREAELYSSEIFKLYGEDSEDGSMPKELGIVKQNVTCHRRSRCTRKGRGCTDESTSNVQSLDSDDEKEIRRYLKLNVDRVSFAGGVIKNIARGLAKFNIFEDYRNSELITDDELRRFRLASMDYRSRDSREKKVSISVPNTDKGQHKQIKRRQTGFVRPEDLEKIHVFHKSSLDLGSDREDSATAISRKVRIAPSALVTPTAPRPARRPTGFVRPSEIDDSDTQVHRQSVLTRLLDDVTNENEYGPTLKDYKPMSETHHKNLLLLTYSPNSRIKSDDSVREKYLRHSITVENESLEQILNMQHGKKVSRKISSDYVKTIDQIEHKLESSIRSVEFAKTRPSMSVSEYQLKNQKYQESLKKTVKTSEKNPSIRGLRLPGDTPLYSMTDVQPLTATSKTNLKYE